jgi:hypothetical protein
MLRRTIALVGGVLLLILLVLGVRGCLNARQERAAPIRPRRSSTS